MFVVIVVSVVASLMGLMSCSVLEDTSDNLEKPNFVIFLVDDLGWRDGRT